MRCPCYDEDELVCGYYDDFCDCTCHGDDDDEFDDDELGLDPERNLE